MFGLSVRLVSLFPELSLFAVYFPPLSFCAKPKAKSQNPFSNKLPSPSGRGGTVKDCGWRPDKSPFPKLSIDQARTFTQEEVFFPLFKSVNSATPGKPYVQNDMRVRWKLEEKPSSLKCGATNAKIKTAFVEYSTHESIKKRCTQHQSKSYTHSTRSLFDWYVWFLSMVGFSIPRTFTLRSILPTLSFCAEPKAKSQNPHP